MNQNFKNRLPLLLIFSLIILNSCGLNPQSFQSEIGFFSSTELGISFEYPEEWNVIELNSRDPLREEYVGWLKLANFYREPLAYPSRKIGEMTVYFDYYITDIALEDFFNENDPYVGEGLAESISLVDWHNGNEVGEEDFNISLDTMTLNEHKVLTSSGELPIHMDDGGPIKSKRYYFRKDDKIFVIHAQASLATGELIDAADTIVNSINFIIK